MILLPGSFSWNVDVVTVEELTASLKVAVTVVTVPIQVALFAGVTEDTVGAVLSNTTSTK